jgi:cysteine synthase
LTRIEVAQRLPGNRFEDMYLGAWRVYAAKEITMKSNEAQWSRRNVVAGAGTAGALAAAAAVLPVKPPAPQAVATKGAGASEPKEGYQLTPHVLRYYETTRV